VTPYADFTYFGLLLYAVVPTLVLGLLGRANWRWALLLTAIILVIQYQAKLKIGAHAEIREIWIVIAFGFWQWAAMRAYAAMGARGGSVFYATMAVCLLPLVLAKVIPVLLLRQFGFLGLSYITFRALDVIFCLRDGVIAAPRVCDFFGFLFFFPTISAGPIDRYRRFEGDWKRRRTRGEFVSDLDAAVHRIFRGFLYKFILAALIKQYWLDRVASEATFGALVSYMYAYSFYLFFDFAGYSAFAIAFSYLLGVHTPENFNRPFLARNIRDFWNRWHITLSFWFRDHVYMRFLLATARGGRWVVNRHVTAILGYFLAFGLMGLWHGIEPHFIIYGIYQATLLSGLHIFSEWSKIRTWPTNSRLWHAGAIFVTFHFVCFGLLIFSGRLGAGPEFNYVGAVERADCDEIAGWAMDKHRPDSPLSVDLYKEKEYVATIVADHFRGDLRDKGYGNGRHGFRMQTPLQFKDGRRHLLSISVTGAKKKITPTPRSVDCLPTGG
jgi:membrane protein involved in D-alanine export